MIVYLYKKGIISEAAQLEEIKGILLASNDPIVYDNLFHDINQWTGPIKMKVIGSGDPVKNFHTIFHMRIDPYAAESYLRKIATNPAFQSHINTWADKDLYNNDYSRYELREDWLLKQAQILSNSGFELKQFLSMFDRSLFISYDIKKLKNLIDFGILKPERDSESIMQNFGRIVCFYDEHKNENKDISIETYMNQLFSLFPESKRESSILSFLGSLASNGRNGQIKNNSADKQTEHVSRILDWFEIIKKICGKLPKATNILFGDIDPYLTPEQRERMTLISDNSSITFTIKDIFDLLEGKLSEGSVSAQNIKNNCTSNVYEYGKLLKSMSGSWVSNEYTADILDIVKSKLWLS